MFTNNIMELYQKLKALVADIETDFTAEDAGTATEVNQQRIEQGMKLMSKLMDTIKLDRALRQIQ